jgi:hypothetical protein
MPDADPFDPETWEAPANATPNPAARKHPSRPRQAGKFLKGPVPWHWLQRAMRLPGKALAVGLLLWLESGIKGRRTVHFCLARAVAEGIPTTTARRAMNALEAAGLVGVERKPGRGLDVKILDSPGGA